MTPDRPRSGLDDKSRFRFPMQPWLRPLHALALASLLIGLSVGVAAAHAAPAPKAHAHVFLIRGFLNVFSLGMDNIAARLQRQGIYATVYNHLAWPLIADEAAAEYKSGRVRTIILVGHSTGADAINPIAERLAAQGIPVKLAIGLDPSVSRSPAAGHIERYVNYYVANGIGHSVDKGPQFRGRLRNINVTRIPGIGHFNIDKNAAMEEKVISSVHAAL